jgi:hypothetical protein
VAFDRDVGITVWVDGASRATPGAFTGNLNNAASLLIGDSPLDSFPHYYGLIDEVALYPSLLTPAQVTAHRNAGIGH